MKKYLIGVDGGNTKTDYLLYDIDGNFIDGIRSGTCSHEAKGLGFDGAYRVMKEHIDALLQKNNVNIKDVEDIIRSIGLYKNKAKNIIALSNELVNKYNGEIIPDFNVLTSLPGVGRKTANVVLSEVFDIPRIAVDTHVLRVSNILNLSESDNPLQVEKDLMSLFEEKTWKDVHLKLLFFGRYLCKAQKQLCKTCPFKLNCKIQKEFYKEVLKNL